MYGTYENIKICGISAATPERVVDNMDLAERFESRRAKRQVQLTGINRRHLCDVGQQASGLATVAAQDLLHALGWKPDEIRVLIFVTQSPEVGTPATAMLIQKRLNIGMDCLVFDVNLGCTGYVSGLQIISSLLQSTKGKGLLLVGDGKYYPLPDKPTTDSLLFGDGASATALEYKEGSPSMLYSQYTDGTRWQLLTRSLDGSMYMDGNAILLFSLDEVSDSIRNFKRHFEIQEDEVDYYILHQAQKILLDGMADNCGIEQKKMLISYDEFGNTSTATIPVTICKNHEKISGGEKHLLMSGFGVGLAWSDVYVSVDDALILPVIYTDKVYNN